MEDGEESQVDERLEEESVVEEQQDIKLRNLSIKRIRMGIAFTVRSVRAIGT